MAMEARYGGIGWFALDAGQSLLFEQHLPGAGQLHRLVTRADGRLQASVLCQGSDPQWRLPVWIECRSAQVASGDDARQYFQAVGPCMRHYRDGNDDHLPGPTP